MAARRAMASVLSSRFIGVGSGCSIQSDSHAGRSSDGGRLNDSSGSRAEWDSVGVKGEYDGRGGLLEGWWAARSPGDARAVAEVMVSLRRLGVRLDCRCIRGLRKRRVRDNAPEQVGWLKQE